MATPESAFLKAVLLRHGARRDLRIWRNARVSAWVGTYVGRTPTGCTVLRGARKIEAGLCDGAADIIGIHQSGRMIALELKAPYGRRSPAQVTFIRVVSDMGALAGFCRTMDEVDAILGVPPT